MAQEPDIHNINVTIPITELLEMGACWMGMVACWWATVLMQGGIFFPNLKTEDCLFVILIFLFTCFRHRFYFCPQATWSLPEASRSLWTNNIQQWELSIGHLSWLFYWYKLLSAITCVVLSMIRLISHDFGQTEVLNMATRNFALKVFYVLALIESLLLLLALLPQLLFERAKVKNKERKEEEKDDQNEAVHKIGIPDETSTCIQQQDSSNTMLNNSGEGTSHKMTDKGVPVKIDCCKENTRGRRKNHIAASSERILEDKAQEFIRKSRESRVSSEDRSLETFKLREWVAISLGSMVFLWAAIMFGGDHMFTLETKDRMFATVIFLLVCIRLFNSCLRVVIRYMSGNNIQQHISRLFYWFQLVSALICVVLSMMGLVSQYYGQTEVKEMVSQHFALSSFYCLTLAEALLSVPKISYIRIMTMLQTFIDTITGWQTDQRKKFWQKYRRMVPTKASEHPVAFIPKQKKCKNKQKKRQ